MEEAKFYRFYNQYRTLVYQDAFYSEIEAWVGFFMHCKYPLEERDIEKVKASGIYWEIAQ